MCGPAAFVTCALPCGIGAAADSAVPKISADETTRSAEGSTYVGERLQMTGEMVMEFLQVGMQHIVGMGAAGLKLPAS